MMILRHPAALPGLVVAFAIGALGGIVPTAFLVSAGAGGAGGGASWGLWLFAALSPAIVTPVAVAVCGARYQYRVDSDLFLSGRSSAACMFDDARGAVALALAMAVSAGLGGAVSASAQSLSHHAPIMTAVSGEALLVAAGSALWWTASGALALALFRDVSKSHLFVGGLLLAGLSIVQLANSQIAWDVFTASPLAPFALVSDAVVAGRRGLQTHLELGVAACLVWPFACAVVVRRRRRFAVPLRP